MNTTIAIVGTAAAIGNALVFVALLSAMAKQPKMEAKLFSRAIIGIAFIEGMFFVSFGLALMFQ